MSATPMELYIRRFKAAQRRARQLQAMQHMLCQAFALQLMAGIRQARKDGMK